MSRFRLFGSDAELTEVAREIMAQDLAALAKRIAEGRDINEPVPISRQMPELPLTVALVEKLEVLGLLLDNGANLNDDDSPAIVSAAPKLQAATIELLVARRPSRPGGPRR